MISKRKQVKVGFATSLVFPCGEEYARTQTIVGWSKVLILWYFDWNALNSISFKCQIREDLEERSKANNSTFYVLGLDH